jgi:hypothetical protein
MKFSLINLLRKAVNIPTTVEELRGNYVSKGIPSDRIDTMIKEYREFYNLDSDAKIPVRDLNRCFRARFGERLKANQRYIEALYGRRI